MEMRAGCAERRGCGRWTNRSSFQWAVAQGKKGGCYKGDPRADMRKRGRGPGRRGGINPPLHDLTRDVARPHK